MLFSSKICFTFVKSTKKGQNEPKIHVIQEMKDRIRQIMESQHMTQQVFADFIGIAPATLSGIFTERTKPTINTVEAIKKKLPNLSTDWLMFGRGPMYTDEISSEEKNQSPDSTPKSMEPQLDFDSSPTSVAPKEQDRPIGQYLPKNAEAFVLKNIDKKPRQITEIRIFFDDQTWESFVPKKN